VVPETIAVSYPRPLSQDTLAGPGSPWIGTAAISYPFIGRHSTPPKVAFERDLVTASRIVNADMSGE
jgi:hypothetical protein